jgi:hypothetical protein
MKSSELELSENRRGFRRWTSSEKGLVAIHIPLLEAALGAEVRLVDLSEGGAMVAIRHTCSVQDFLQTAVTGYLVDVRSLDRFDFSADITWLKTPAGVENRTVIGLQFHNIMKFTPRMIGYMYAEGYLN